MTAVPKQDGFLPDARRLVLLVAGALAGLMLALVVVARLYIRSWASKETAYSQTDVAETLGAVVDSMCTHVAGGICGQLGTARPVPAETLRTFMRDYVVDEINIADKRGIWVASTVPALVNTPIKTEGPAAAFRQLLSGRDEILSQPFRASASEPNIRRKYVGRPFPDKSGFIQVGIDASRIQESFELYFREMLREWYAGHRVYYLIAEPDDGTIQCGGRDASVGAAKTLREAGFRQPLDRADGKRMYDQRLFGELCWCRYTMLFGHVVVTVLPKAEGAAAVGLIVGLPMLILTAVFGVLLIIYLTGEKTRRAHAAMRLVEEKRRAEDLATARSIQKSALPTVFPPYPRDLRMDLYAQMDPARDVGGDFYDFFYVGADRLAILVADVSGKGVPAAMFMMKAKTLLRSLLLSVTDLAEAVQEANVRLCEGNDADMFVTAWIGILDERSGSLRYVNAGHNPPYVRRADGTLETLTAISGVFLGGFAESRYRTAQTKLRRGDLLFLYTDGVTEANNMFGQMFGEKRLEEVLNGARGLGLARFVAQPRAVTPQTVCSRMRGAVDAFVGENAQFDDITMLAVTYRGNPECVSKTVPAEIASVATLNAFAEETLDAAKCPKDAKSSILVALDEISNNIASYSGSPEMRLDIEIARNPFVIRLRMSDAGTPWNPLDHLDPDITLSADEREVGGLGILMVKKLMDDVSYVYADGKNVFSFRKTIGEK